MDALAISARSQRPLRLFAALLPWLGRSRIIYTQDWV
jgi:hypothetical protein